MAFSQFQCFSEQQKYITLSMIRNEPKIDWELRLLDFNVFNVVKLEQETLCETFGKLPSFLEVLDQGWALIEFFLFF